MKSHVFLSIAGVEPAWSGDSFFPDHFHAAVGTEFPTSFSSAVALQSITPILVTAEPMDELAKPSTIPTMRHRPRLFANSLEIKLDS